MTTSDQPTTSQPTHEAQALPSGWVEARLGELNCYRSDNVKPSDFPSEVFELYSVPAYPYGTPELQMGATIGSTKQSTQEGDVLLCKINPRINRVWEVGAKRSHRQIGSSEWIIFRVPEMHAAFYTYFFKSPLFREKLCENLTGVGGSLTRAQPKRVANFSVPLPPLAEQKRIADKLDTLLARVDAGREQLERVPELLTNFRQSVLSRAVSGELTREWRGGEDAEWEEVKFGEVGKVSTGSTPKKSNAEYYGGSIPFVRPAELLDGLIGTTEITLSEKGFQTGRHVRAGAVFLSCIGNLGKTGIATVPSGFNQQINALEPNNDILTDAFAHIYCMTLRPWLEANASATTIAIVNKGRLLDAPFILPPIAEQAEIVRRVEALFNLADRVEAKYEAAMAAYEQLTPALLQKAFRGELVPQDPNDEPASVLLERIRTQRAAEQPKKGKRKKAGTAKAAASAEQPKKRGRPRKAKAQAADSKQPKLFD